MASTCQVTKSYSMLLIIAALVLISYAPLGHAQNIVTINVKGNVTVPSLNLTGGVPCVAGVTVRASCNVNVNGLVNSILTSTAVTNSNGSFTITLPPLLSPRLNITQCNVTVPLPVSPSTLTNCTALPAVRGVLTTVPQLAGVAVSLVNMVVDLLAGPFTLQLSA